MSDKQSQSPRGPDRKVDEGGVVDPDAVEPDPEERLFTSGPLEDADATVTGRAATLL